VDLVKVLADQGRVIPVWDTAALPQAVSSVPPRLPPVEETVKPIHRAVAEALG
jgi:hypothetical protein